MTVKSLKKQLMAAIAMVLVATIALGSSTYAWFAANNQVTAKASQIGVQSNAGSLVIKYAATAVSSDLTADVASIAATSLYPAQWANGSGSYRFETGYASLVTAPDLKAGTLVPVGTTGTPAEAVAAEYAVQNVFNVSAKGDVDLTNLKVTAASISDSGNTNLDNALRVLVVCGSNWVLCDKNGIVVDSAGGTDGLLAGTVTHGADTEVDLYVYYDGNDAAVYTNNLAALTASDSSKIMITLETDTP
ncbi:MAG: hypothetical protein J6X14_09565 [Lachnospiraceae bacterium]|nr:hypothetical protein [Lachnospiraceae bacterium]